MLGINTLRALLFWPVKNGISPWNRLKSAGKTPIKIGRVCPNDFRASTVPPPSREEILRFAQNDNRTLRIDKGDAQNDKRTLRMTIGRSE